MQIVIDIPEDMYNGIINNRRPLGCIAEMLDAIKNGTPLPKGHGRLIDADDVNNHIVGFVDLSGCPTIIESEEY